MKNRSRMARALVLAVALFAFSSSLTAARREGAMSRTAFDKLTTLKVSERGVIPKVPLNGASLQLELERFEVWAPDAKIIERGANGERELAIPAIKTFKGRVTGYDDSLAFVSIGDELSGLIIIGTRKYVIAPTPKSRMVAGGEIELHEQFDDDVPLESTAWQCALDQFGPLSDTAARSPIPGAEKLVMTPQATTDSSALYQLRLAIEADHEMTTLLSNNTGNVTNYITNLIGAATVIYERDVRTRLVVGVSFVYAANNDPWTTSSNLDALRELGTYYHNNRGAVSRSAAMLLMGKNTGGGVAWVGTMCGNDFPATLNGISGWGGHYGVVGSLSGVVSTNPVAVGFWDVLGFTHELGHVAGSRHTHCTASSGYGRAFVDLCRSGESSNVPCYSGAQSVPVEKGTIMSYCHLLSGGYSNVRLIFGQGGEASEVVNTNIISTIDPVTPNGNMTIDGSSVTPTVPAGSAHNAALPGGSSSYSWSISNGTINGSTTSSTVNFTTGTFGTPTVLTGTVSNTNGCAVVNSRSIPLTGSPPPTAVADTYNATEDVTLSVSAPGVLTNDTGSPTSATLASQANSGTVTLNANGSFSYVPVANFNGSDSFSYRAVNAGGNSSPVSVSLNVAAVNDPTNAADDIYQTNEDNALNVTVGPGVLSNDTDVDGAMTVAVLSNVTNGTLSLNANGSFLYTPASNFTGSDSFTYRASQGGGFDDAAVTITVNAVEDPTVVVNDVYGATEDVTLNVSAPGVLANDSDADGAITASIVTMPANGTLSLNANGSFSYLAAANYNGPDSFVYRASGAGSNATATVTINVASAYDPPNAANDAYSTAMNTPLVVAPSGVLSNDRLDVGSPSATQVSPPTNGALALNPDGSFTYTPNNNFLGADTFTYSITDGLNTDNGTVTISVVDLMPDITSVNPNSTDAGSGTSINITGINFKTGVVVRFDGAIIGAVRNSSSSLTATVPAPTLPGRMNTIETCNPDGGCRTATKKFTTNFADVPQSSPYRPFINTIFRNELTGGCGGGNYCPNSGVTRAQMAVFLLRAKEGNSYVAPDASGTVFGDVPAGYGFARWIEELAARNVTGGCGGGNYCPDNPATREQMAIFLLRTLEGPSYVPIDAVGQFGDVPASSPYARWIEELARRGITGGCGGGNFCPLSTVPREQMAVFLVTTFGLQ